MGIFHRIKDRREERKEEKNYKWFSKPADPETYFSAAVLVFTFILFALYTLIKEFYFG